MVLVSCVTSGILDASVASVVLCVDMGSSKAKGWQLLGEAWVGSERVLVVCGQGLAWGSSYKHGLW